MAAMTTTKILSLMIEAPLTKEEGMEIVNAIKKVIDCKMQATLGPVRLIDEFVCSVCGDSSCWGCDDDDDADFDLFEADDEGDDGE